MTHLWAHEDSSPMSRPTFKLTIVPPAKGTAATSPTASAAAASTTISIAFAAAVEGPLRRWWRKVLHGSDPVRRTIHDAALERRKGAEPSLAVLSS